MLIDIVQLKKAVLQSFTKSFIESFWFGRIGSHNPSYQNDGVLCEQREIFKFYNKRKRRCTKTDKAAELAALRTNTVWGNLVYRRARISVRFSIVV